LNDEKHSYKLSEKYLKPYTYKRSEPYARKRMGDGVPFA
jgi:hypothetical protein